MDIECVQGDITAQSDLDVIVNAANARLSTGAPWMPSPVLEKPSRGGQTQG